MVRQFPGYCPVCGEGFEVVKLHCPACDTSIEGRFGLDRLGRLNAEQRAFVEVFLKSRGNIKEVERELGISYPTVRNRLDAIIERLGYRIEAANNDNRARRGEVLQALEEGEIGAEEASKLLRQLSRSKNAREEKPW